MVTFISSYNNLLSDTSVPEGWFKQYSVPQYCGEIIELFSPAVAILGLVFAPCAPQVITCSANVCWEYIVAKIKLIAIVIGFKTILFKLFVFLILTNVFETDIDLLVFPSPLAFSDTTMMHP